MLTKIKNWALALLFPPTIVIEEPLNEVPLSQSFEELTFPEKVAAVREKVADVTAQAQTAKKPHSAIPLHIKVKGAKKGKKR